MRHNFQLYFKWWYSMLWFHLHKYDSFNRWLLRRKMMKTNDTNSANSREQIGLDSKSEWKKRDRIRVRIQLTASLFCYLLTGVPYVSSRQGTRQRMILTLDRWRDVRIYFNIWISLRNGRRCIFVSVDFRDYLRDHIMRRLLDYRSMV